VSQITVPTPAASLHPAWADIDLDALTGNARLLRGVVPAATRLAVLVKANGYGHGTVMSARAALAGGADALVVAAFDEAIAVREAGIRAPVLVVYPVDPRALAEAAARDVAVSVSGLASARQLAAAWAKPTAGGGHADPRARRLRVHVEVDSGMARGGARPEQVVASFEALEAAPGVAIEGLWSHLASGGDRAATTAQVEAFERAIGLVRASGRQVPPRHLTATEGLFTGNGPAYDMVRIGLAFYGELGTGVRPAPGLAGSASGLRPAMTVRARAVHLEPVPAGGSVGYGGEWTAGRDSVIATLPLGYSDGWARAYWPGGEVLVRGRRVPIAGRVSMDAISVDVTGVPGVGLDDEYVLLGAQGGERVTADELARLRHSISYEVISTLGPRIPRRYAGSLVATSCQ
jgi:alanine racemase